jgi:prevent-host-death family protein
MKPNGKPAHVKPRAKTLSASEFKARCLKILDELQPEGLVVTKRGRPVAKVTPIRIAKNADLIGCMKGKVKIKGDIFSTGIKWNAESGQC